MKKIFISLILFLAACVPMAIEANLDACAMGDLQSVDFFKGDTTGAPLSFEEKDGVHIWRLSSDADRLYIRCYYGGGDAETKVLPLNLSECRAKVHDNGVIAALSCTARM